jgi:hypothetical protein
MRVFTMRNPSPFQFDRKTLRIVGVEDAATLERQFVSESEVERIVSGHEARVLVNRERDHLEEIAFSDLQGFWRAELRSHIASSEDSQLSDFDRGFMFFAELWSGPAVGRFLILFYRH